MNRIVATHSGVSLLAIPPPYKAWLALSSDPDDTTPHAWREVHEFIWDELALPFADSLFISNHNNVSPGQVTLVDNSDYIAAHAHDTIHTWGDYIFSGSYRFTRKDAIDALKILRKHNISPLVWTDHSNFSGNLLHRSNTKCVPTLLDSSGQKYENDIYTLDLIREAGVRYVWDGYLVNGVVGQDRNIGRFAWYRESARKFAPHNRIALAIADCISKPLEQFRNQQIFDFNCNANKQYAPVEFPDGNRFYAFKRFGSWRLGDIDGVASVISKTILAQLIQNQGTMILYTHLGKRNASGESDKEHIPTDSKKAFRAIASAYKDKELNLSATSKLLDYLVLRDHAVLAPQELNFAADGIRYDSLLPSDLSGHQFGLVGKVNDLRVSCAGKAITDFELIPCGNSSILSFPEIQPSH